MATFSKQGRQWIRKAQLLIAKKATDVSQTTTPALDLSELHFTFHVATSDLETPNNMVATVYNLDPAMIQTIVQEYDQVSLSAGYENANFGIIFTGTIRWFRSGRDRITDNFLEITAGDNDKGYNFGFINTTLAPDVQTATWQSVYDESVKAFGVQPDEESRSILAQGGIVFPRGRVLFAPARVVMHELAESLKARWFVLNGVLIVIQDQSVRKGAATILGPDTGLVGQPQQTDQGIVARCLLNPSLAIGSKVVIRKELIVQTSIIKNFLSYTDPVFIARVSPSDTYRILQIDYTGDTRGQDWYCDIICAAMDPVDNTVVGVP
jgi:hypothetical protein